MTEPKRYMIKTLDDFLGVPDDRIDQCLKEFAIFIYTARFVASSAEEACGKKVVEVGGFEWIDDGDLDVSIQLRTVEQLPGAAIELTTILSHSHPLINLTPGG